MSIVPGTCTMLCSTDGQVCMQVLYIPGTATGIMLISWTQSGSNPVYSSDQYYYSTGVLRVLVLVLLLVLSTDYGSRKVA